MSVRSQDSRIRPRPWLLCLGCAVMAAAAPSGALAAPRSGAAARATRAARVAVRDTPTQVIDANTDPDAAAQALTAGCADVSKCRWQTDSVTAGYGPARILGDVLYNCSTEEGEDAETAVGVSDERSETTSVSEKLSLKLSLGLIGLASSSVEFEAFSKQAETFSTKVTVSNAVAVPPGYKGYTTTQVLSANVSGNTYITEGINKLIEVKDIDLTFPGYQTTYDQGDARIIYNGIKAPMTPADIASRCNAVNDNPTSLLGAAPATPPKSPKVLTGSFTLTLCQPRASCATRKVTGPPPPARGHGRAGLTAHGVTYAAGTDTAGRIQLTVRRRIKPGNYTLRLREGGARGRAMTYSTTIIPITIR